MELSGGVGEVDYRWGQCGDSPPGKWVDDNSTFTPEVMQVTLWRGTTATYTMQPDGNLIGEYYRPRDGSTATGQFRLVK